MARSSVMPTDPLLAVAVYEGAAVAKKLRKEQERREEWMPQRQSSAWSRATLEKAADKFRRSQATAAAHCGRATAGDAEEPADGSADRDAGGRPDCVYGERRQRAEEHANSRVCAA